MTDIVNNDFTAFVKYLVNHAVFADTDPIQVFSAGEPVCIVGNRLPCQSFDMFKDVRDDFPGIFRRSFSALFLRATV